MKITLCGSTRFEKQYTAWNKYLTLIGHTVYSLGYWPPNPRPSEDEKTTLDLVHLAKIEESECIFVIDCIRLAGEGQVEEPYIGESTSREIQWAHIRHKPVFYSHIKGIENAFGGRITFNEQIGGPSALQT